MQAPKADAITNGHSGLPDPGWFEHQDAGALRSGRWKAVFGKRFPEEPTWNLYDLATDRCETTDLAAEHPGRTREVGRRLRSPTATRCPTREAPRTRWT